MHQTKEGKPEIFPDVKIGVRPDGSAYYAKDLAAELKEAEDTLDWAQNHIFDNDDDPMRRVELSPVAKLFVQFHTKR